MQEEASKTPETTGPLNIPVEASAEETTETATTNERSEYIPRERFDQVNSNLQQAAAQNTELQNQVRALQQQLLIGQTAQTPYSQQAASLSGMVQPPQQEQAPALDISQLVPGLSEADNNKWKEKITKEGPKAIQEMVMEFISPLANQLHNSVQTSVQPLQAAYVDQQRTAYEQSRANDPAFSTIQPYFRSVLNQVLGARPNLQLNSPTLQLIESVAKQQAAANGVSALPQQQLPYSESPGAARQESVGNSATVSLTQEQQRTARGFGMTDEQYLNAMNKLNEVRRDR